MSDTTDTTSTEAIQAAFTKAGFPYERLNKAGIQKATDRLTPKEGEAAFTDKEIARRVEQLVSIFICNQKKYFLE